MIIRRDSIQIDPLSAYSLDMLEFATLIDATRLHQHRTPNTCPPCAENRTRAIPLYQGDFLDQLSLGDCPAFESWTVIKREQCRSLVLRALLSLTSFYLHRRKLELAQRHASRQIEIDPLREQAYRQSTAALRNYETCRRLLKEELDIEPEEAIQCLYHLIKGFLFWSRDESIDTLADYR